MGTVKGVSVPALRILTYTILIKAVISAVMLTCKTAAGIIMRTAATDLPVTESIFFIAQVAAFINIIACVMCLSGIAALSERFIAVQRLMVAVLLTECMSMLISVMGIIMTVAVNDKAIVINTIHILLLTDAAAERLLVGAAFLFLMKGFGGMLAEYGDQEAAAACERIGSAYLLCSTACAVISWWAKPEANIAVLAAAVTGLACIVLEILMYRKASAAAFRIWRKRAFSITEDGEGKLWKI